MKITETETLYSKKGRRYVPAYSLAHWNYDGDMMPVGSFRLVHAYSDGGRRYAYDVTPDTAGWVAAATLAVHAMTEAIHKANQLTIASGTPWTKKQQAAIAQANAILDSVNFSIGKEAQSCVQDHRFQIRSRLILEDGLQNMGIVLGVSTTDVL